MSTPGKPRTARPCPDCNKPTPIGGRCAVCKQRYDNAHNAARTRYRTAAWKRLRTTIISRDFHQCVVCSSNYRLAVHHIHPVAQGGQDAPDNLVTLCQRCHSRLEAGNETTEQNLAAHLKESPFHA